jgi:[ribosomal protein S18]-alanine N-acetyltransferase
VEIVAMTLEFAADIAGWQYPPPYDCYDMTGADPVFLTSAASGYFALVDDRRLIGFRSFGIDGQVPGGSYDSSALDTGGGLRPELTGRGLGRPAISTGLEFGRRKFRPPAFRMTVASFNIRAQRVVADLGFGKIASFSASADGRGYGLWIRSERYPDEPAG